MSLGLFTQYLDALNDDEKAKVSRLTQNEQRERATIKKYTELFASALRTNLLKKIGDLGLSRFSATHLGTAEELTSALENGVPIGAKRSCADSDIQSALTELDPASPIDRSQAAFALFRDEPVAVAEVLCAGWIIKNKQRVDWLQKGFAEGDQSRIFPSLKKALESQDSLLIKSIEVISVMGEVTRAP